MTGQGKTQLCRWELTFCNDTVRSNLLLARPDASADDLEAALRPVGYTVHNGRAELTSFWALLGNRFA